jgi:hypothetical protein
MSRNSPAPDEYCDDPTEAETTNSRFSKIQIFISIMIVLASTFSIKSTLASNISFNSGGAVEFGQGFGAYTACSGQESLTLLPNKIFDGTNFYLKSVTVSNIPQTCEGKDFKLSAYGAKTLQNGSMKFTGGSQHLSFPANSGFNFGTGDFTIEGWYNLSNIAPSGSSPALWIIENGNAYFMLIVRAGSGLSGQLSLYLNFTPTTGDPWAFQNTANNTFPANTWTHLAAMRSGDTYSLFMNGKCVAVLSGAASYSMGSGALPLKIGANTTGLISNFRIVKGSKVYNYGTNVGTTYFTPPTSPLTNISGTQLLLNSPAGINFSTDYSSNALSPTNLGSVASSTDSPFAGTGITLPATLSPIFNLTSTVATIYDTTTAYVAGTNSAGTTVTTNSTAPTGSFTVSFDAPVLLATELQVLTLQSGAHTS